MLRCSSRTSGQRYQSDRSNTGRPNMASCSCLMAAILAVMLICHSINVEAEADSPKNLTSARSLLAAKSPSGGSKSKSSGGSSGSKKSKAPAPKSKAPAPKSKAHAPKGGTQPAPKISSKPVYGPHVAKAPATGHHIPPAVLTKVPIGSPPPRAAGDGWLYGGGHDVLVENVEPGRRLLND